MKSSLLAVAIILLTVAGSARAALVMNGSVGVTELSYGGSFTSSSLVLNSSTMILAETGIFTSLVPTFSELTSYTGTLADLSTTPTTENIDDFFVFSTPNSMAGASGTAPNNRFEFNLGALSEVAYNSAEQSASFVGTGTLVDSQNIYASSPAEFDLSFSAEGNYSFMLAAVPEPNQYGIYTGGFAFLALLFGLLRPRLSR